MGLGNKMFHGAAWSAIEKVAIQVLQFFLGIVLARLLTPKEYGTVGLLMVFIAISHVFINSGFAKALIQKKDRSRVDISTVFIFNVGISVVCFLILLFIAPLVADFYDIQLLIPLLRVLAITLIINALYAVPRTLLTIEMDFKTLSKITLSETIISGSIAIFLAYNGHGVWALVWQQIIRAVAGLLLTWYFVKWKPVLEFSKASFSQMFKFGSNLLVSSLLSTIVNNISALFIARLSSTRDLGYYTRGTQFADAIHGLVSSVLNRVLLPGLSPLQDQRELLVKHTKKIITTVGALTVPIYLFMAVVADPLIRVLLTEKWSPAAPIMQFFCVARMFTLISGINVNLLFVIGRTDLTLKQQVFKIIVRVVLLAISLPFGIVYVAAAELLSTLIHFFINTYHPGKIMKYGAFEQLNDLKYIYLTGVIMVILVYTSMYFIENDFVKLGVAGVVSVTVYLICIKLFGTKEYEEMLIRSKGFLKGKD